MISKAVLRAHLRDSDRKIDFDGGSELADSHLDQNSSKKRGRENARRTTPLITYCAESLVFMWVGSRHQS